MKQFKPCLVAGGVIEDRLIIDRCTADVMNRTTYFTGKPCINGHIAEHRVANYECCECNRINKRLKIFDNKNTKPKEPKKPREPKVTPCSIAKSQNKTRYISVTPCKTCGSLEKYTRNSTCCACTTRLKKERREFLRLNKDTNKDTK